MVQVGEWEVGRYTRTMLVNQLFNVSVSVNGNKSDWSDRNGKR
jgi:hypothetical protein